MKKVSFLLLVLIFATSLLNAQRFKGGVIGGINASQIDGDTWAGYHKIGLVAGAYVKTDFVDKWGGQLEIKYSSKGSANAFSTAMPLLIQLRYIDLPILATYEAIDNLKVEGGISINYLFNAQHYDGVWSDEWDIEPSPLEAAITFGINYRFFQSFDMNLRYSYSLLPVRSKTSTDSFGRGAWFNNVFTFALYFEIGNRKL